MVALLCARCIVALFAGSGDCIDDFTLFDLGYCCIGADHSLHPSCRDSAGAEWAYSDGGAYESGSSTWLMISHTIVCDVSNPA